MILSRMVFVAGLLCAIPVAADADVIVIIPGTADPWLAGMPDGLTASDGDTAPAQSPVEVLGLFFGPGGLRFFSTGATDHCGGGACGLAGAEGDFTEAIPGHLTGVAGAENGIGNIFAPIDSLIGLFLGPGAPNLSAAPESVLDFSTAASRDFATLSPLLKQPFYIGNGLRSDGVTAQSFFIPADATRLFLGTMDGFGWFNNVGSLTVTINDDITAVPEPATLGLMTIGMGVAAIVRYRRRQRKV